MKWKRLISVLPLYASLANSVRVQKKYLSRHIGPEVKAIVEQNDGTIDREDLDKIMHYYGMGVPAVVGELICTLRGTPMTATERLCSTYQGAITGLFDDFFDKTHFDEGQIREMLRDPFGFTPSASLEILFISFLKRIHRSIGNKDLFLSQTEKVFRAQKKSKEQLDPNLSLRDIKEISIEKGGHSLLFYRSAFGQELTIREEEALYESGGLMQLGNDIFDVFEDHRDQIRTIATAVADIRLTRDIYRKQLGRALRSIDQIPGKRHPRLFREKFLLAASRIEVCLDQLYRLQRKNDGVFDPDTLSRKDLICDMQKPANVISYLAYFLRSP